MASTSRRRAPQRALQLVAKSRALKTHGGRALRQLVNKVGAWYEDAGDANQRVLSRVRVCVCVLCNVAHRVPSSRHVSFFLFLFHQTRTTRSMP